MNTETLRVLVHTHPDPAEHFEPQRSVWLEWAGQSETHLIPWPQSQFDTDYVEHYKPDTIIVGGQKSWACILNHLEALVTNDYVIQHNIQVSVSRSATFGGHLEVVVNDVYNRTGIVVGIVD